VAEDARLLRDLAKDEVITYADVQLPADRLVDRLRAEQDERFFGSPAARRPEVRASSG
jgi:predicted homoserine dehydrogenase-like protein